MIYGVHIPQARPRCPALEMTLRFVRRALHLDRPGEVRPGWGRPCVTGSPPATPGQVSRRSLGPRLRPPIRPRTTSYGEHRRDMARHGTSQASRVCAGRRSISAEGVGFEPTLGSLLKRFSRPPRSVPVLLRWSRSRGLSTSTGVRCPLPYRIVPAGPSPSVSIVCTARRPPRAASVDVYAERVRRHLSAPASTDRHGARTQPDPTGPTSCATAHCGVADDAIANLIAMIKLPHLPMRVRSHIYDLVVADAPMARKA